jgi:hypothetical protein
MRYNRIEEHIENASLRTARTNTGVKDEVTEKIKLRYSPVGSEPSLPERGGSAQLRPRSAPPTLPSS